MNNELYTSCMPLLCNTTATHKQRHCDSNFQSFLNKNSRNHTDKARGHIVLILSSTRASLVAQRLKRLPGMRETWVRSRGQEDPLEKEMATHSSTLAWRIPWREEPGGLQSTGSQRVGHDCVTSLHLSSM